MVGAVGLLLGADHRANHPVSRPAGGDAPGAMETFVVIETAAGAEQQGPGAEDHGADGNKEDEHEHGTTTAQSGE